MNTIIVMLLTLTFFASCAHYTGHHEMGDKCDHAEKKDGDKKSAGHGCENCDCRK